MRHVWLTVAMLVVALHCYHLQDAQGVFQGVVLVDEEAWRFDRYDAQGRHTESGDADALPSALTRLGFVEKARPCTEITIPCFGRATRC